VSCSPLAISTSPNLAEKSDSRTKSHSGGRRVVFTAKELACTRHLAAQWHADGGAARSQACCGRCSGTSPRAAEQFTTVLPLDVPCVLNIQLLDSVGGILIHSAYGFDVIASLFSRHPSSASSCSRLLSCHSGLLETPSLGSPQPSSAVHTGFSGYSYQCRQLPAKHRDP
jgi:hypothetical protein